MLHNTTTLKENIIQTMGTAVANVLTVGKTFWVKLYKDCFV